MAIYKLKVIQLLLSMLLFLFIGCGADSPNKSEAETAIIESLKDKVPSQIIHNGAYFSSPAYKIEEIKIIEIGAVQGKGTDQYWPVKLNVAGLCARGKVDFKGEEIVYNITLDGFGVWKAKYDRNFK